MRFIDTETYEITKTSANKYAESDGKYAILSHRWITRKKEAPPRAEITFPAFEDRNAELVSLSQDPRRYLRTGEHVESMNKIIDACAVAKGYGLDWLWLDTCCIHQSDPGELDEAVNSMFQWYSNAEVCIAYLADVAWSGPSGDPFRSTSTERIHSEWFERGWTLQELLAPQRLELYDCKWQRIGAKKDLAGHIEQITKIGQTYLKSSTPLATIKTASVAARISWMAGRTTGRPEDIAYSLVGILGVQFKPSYGEGSQAFLRLEERLLQTSKDESIFAWTWPKDKQLSCFRKLKQGEGSKYDIPTFDDSKWGLLAPSPDCFYNSGKIVTTGKIVERLAGGYRRTNQGVQFEVSFKPHTEATTMFGLPRKQIDWPLNCWSEEGIRGETIVLHLCKNGDNYLRDRLGKLDQDRKAKPTDNKVNGIDQQMTRALVITQPILSVNVH